MTASNGTTNIRWLLYQPPITSKPYPTITVSTGNCPRNYPPIWPYTDRPAWTARGDRYARASCTGNQAIYWRALAPYLFRWPSSFYKECNMHSVVIYKGVGSKQHTPLTLQFQGNHVRTNECVWHGQNVAGPGWDCTSTSSQSRDWEWNKWRPRSTKQDQEVVTSEVQNKMIIMQHQILSCHVPVVRSFFILWKMLLSSWNIPYDHLPICTNITFQYHKKWPCFVP